MVTFEVPGKPMGKARPRATRNGHIFMPEEYVSYKERVQASWRAATDFGHFWEGPVVLEVGVCRARPKGHYRTNGSLSAAGRRDPLPMTTPDLDNIAGSVMDALNGFAWKDDSQIVDVHAYRTWGDRHSVTVSIMDPLSPDPRFLDEDDFDMEMVPV